MHTKCQVVMNIDEKNQTFKQTHRNKLIGRIVQNKKMIGAVTVECNQ